MRLLRRWLDVALVDRGLLCRIRRSLDAARAVETHMVDGSVVDDDGSVHIDVGDVGTTNVYDCAVVKESAMAPFTAEESDATVAKAIVDAAVKADMRTPISGVPAVISIRPAPVPRGPEQAYGGRGNPRTRNPVVALIAPGPVARSPHVARLGALRLYIDRQRRRSHCDRHNNARKRRGRQGQHQQCKYEQAGEAGDMHCVSLFALGRNPDEIVSLWHGLRRLLLCFPKLMAASECRHGWPER